jgi:hypothetical protein
MADRSQFWKMVDATNPDKLSGLSSQQLRDYQKYFLEMQFDPTLPDHEVVVTSERLTLLRSEIDIRRSTCRHRQTQVLACIGILLAILGLARCH